MRYAIGLILSLFAAAVPAAEPYPITLPTALKLSGAKSLDIAAAARRVEIAGAQYDRSQLLWLPNVLLGADYTRHDGQIQDIRGTVFGTSRSATFVGVGPALNLATSEACFAPLAARQEFRARVAERQAAENDTLLAVAEAYCNLQQARGELVLAPTIIAAADDLKRKAEALAEGLAPPLEATRARTEWARRKQAVLGLEERQKNASAELCRLLRLPADTPIVPAEPADLLITLVDPYKNADELIPVALANRPELASRQAVVAATLARLKQEKLRPLTPSILLRGVSTTNPGLGGGYFGGGVNGSQTAFGARSDWDAQIVWELQNFGFGNAARVRERKAEHELAMVDVFRTQDRVAADVVQALAQVAAARDRLGLAADALKEAQDLVAKSLEGMRQTRRSGEFVVLVIRPSEVVAAIQSLAQCASDYYSASADYNRGQFRLYRAMGHSGAWSEQCEARIQPR